MGFLAYFFKHSWDLILPLVEAMVNSFFSHIHDLSHLNQTNIALIPKIDNPSTPNHFRPISLCNKAYKIISKILALRLKPLLPKIISPMQSAFVVKRQITDNIIIAHEIIHSVRSSKSKHTLMAIKIDMAKAFDKLSWLALILCSTSWGSTQTGAS